MHRPGPGSTVWLTAATLLWLGASGCGGNDDESAAGRSADAPDQPPEAQETPATPTTDGGSRLLERLPDMCALLTAEEASELLGSAAQTPDGAPDEGRSGSLCRYIADRENRLGFELFMLPHTVWNPATGTVEDLVALSQQTRSSGPMLRVWADAPALGGYYAQEEGATTAWIVTPYGWTPGLSDEASSQVYLRAYVHSPFPPSARLALLADLGERIVPRLRGR